MGRTLLPFILLFSLPALPGRLFAARPLDVVINELSWAGTLASGSDEWIELLNPTPQDISLSGWTLRAADGTPTIVLSGTIPAGGYFLLERTDDAAVSDVPAQKFFSGAVANGPPAEDFILMDAGSQTIDQLPFAAAGWPAGTASPDFRSMERIDPSRPGNLAANWASNDLLTRNGSDADGAPLNGTPGRRNSAFGVLREMCGNGQDDDTDGKADCLDEECALDESCRTAADISSSSWTGPALQVDRKTNPFSPGDFDPARRAARLHFHVDSAEAVKSIRVFNVRGECVRRLIDQDRGADGRNFAGTKQGSLFWDGTDDRGNGLPTGIYIVFLEAVAPAGGHQRARVTVVLAR